MKIFLVAIFSIVSVAGAADKAPLSDGWIKATSFPPDVISAIKGAPLSSKDSLSGYRVLDDQIIRVDQLTINALSTTSIRLRDINPKFPYYIIAARVINIEMPAQRKDAAVITYAPQFGSLDGNGGSIGPRGSSWPDDWQDENGAFGGPGGVGENGGVGKSVIPPLVYVVYQHIFTTGGSPTSSLALSFDLNGFRAGNGGRGGKGGQGGNGARGIAGGASGICPVCSCDRGPGIGGDAGPRGTGGRGGDAGRGGDGGSIVFIGPKGKDDQYIKTISGNFQVLQAPGAPGVPGQPGEMGEGGRPGGGGEAPRPCNGRSSGNGSPSANPVDLGPGHPNSIGNRGTQSYFERDNSDLF
jgi:hypothetical protein